MSVFVTGDTHCPTDIGKLMPRAFDYSGLTRDDYLIVTGDFGVVFGNRDAQGNPPAREIYWLEWLSSRPWTTLFVDGNHENHPRLASDFPVRERMGGKVHELAPGVYHLMRGEVFEIDGKRYLAMGGASSADKAFRKEGIDWWAKEIPSEEERKRCISNLDACGWKVDYVLTHDCPLNVFYELSLRAQADVAWKADDYKFWLQYVADRLDFGRWFFGHYHMDAPSLGIGGKFTCLYNEIYDVTEGSWCARKKDVEHIRARDVPEPAHGRGYTVAEIAAIAGCPVSDVERAMGHAMRGATCPVDAESGEMLYYRADVEGKVLPLVADVSRSEWHA